jgi:adenylate cyclase
MLMSWTLRICIAALAFALAAWVQCWPAGFVARLDEGFRDGFVQWAANDQAEDRLVVIDINEASLSEIGSWPWPRDRLADLVEILLSKYNAHAVGLDMVFPERADAGGDARLAALAAHAPLSLAQVFDYSPRSPAISQGKLAGGQDQTPKTQAVDAYGFIGNHSGLANARCVGNIGYLPDADGVLRRTAVHTRFEGQVYPHFSSVLLTCAGNHHSIVVDEKNSLWRVPYHRSLSAYTVIPAADILTERAPRSLIAGRYVLVGASSLGLGDRVSTPLAPLNAGVMVHAANLSGLLDLTEGQTKVAWSGTSLLLAWSAMTIALAVFFIARLSAWSSVLLLMGLVTCWLGLAFAGIAEQAEWSVTAPLWGYFFLLLVAVPHEWWQTQRRTRRLMNTFSHYVAQPVLDEIVRLGLNHSLAPTLRDVTVLIADMEDYTRTTSSLSLDDAADLTKDFLDCLTRPVLTWRGTLDKYTGDGLVAFWGAPLACPQQADWAVSAALAILTEVDGFNAKRRLVGMPPVRVRIGIESGKALVGDLGTTFRSTYTAVGDCINFASRLESAARDLPTRLVIGPAARNNLVEHTTTSLGQINLRGTQTSIEVFTMPSEQFSLNQISP